MTQAEASRQFSFRLPEPLVKRVEKCTDELRAVGLDVSRADVVRLLLKHALDATQCQFAALFQAPDKKVKSRARRR
jgi:hypothetical protein